MQEPIHRRGGQCFGHDRIEPAGVKVGSDRDTASFVRAIDNPVKRFGGVLPGGQHADVLVNRVPWRCWSARNG